MPEGSKEFNKTRVKISHLQCHIRSHMMNVLTFSVLILLE